MEPLRRMDDSLEEAIQAIVRVLRSIHHGAHTFVLASAAARMHVTAAPLPAAAAQTPFAALTKREREILTFLLHGHGNAAIGRALCISVKTVETHRTRILKKLGVHSMVELMRKAIAAGLLGAGRNSDIEVRVAEISAENG